MTGSSTRGKQPSIFLPDSLSLSKLTIFLSRSLQSPLSKLTAFSLPLFSLKHQLSLSLSRYKITSLSKVNSGHSYFSLTLSSFWKSDTKLSLSKLTSLYLPLSSNLRTSLAYFFSTSLSLTRLNSLYLPTLLSPSFSDKQTNELKSIGRERPRSVTAWPAATWLTDGETN